MRAYPTGGTAQYPTVYQAGSPPYGPIHWGPRAVAYLGDSVSLENEADFGPEEDPTNNLQPPEESSNRDGGDDGVALPLVLPNYEATTFEYTVTVVNPAPGIMYANVWFDWNRDGDWDDLLSCPNGAAAPEWAVQNQPVALTAVGTLRLVTPSFVCWHPAAGDLAPIWMRITLSETPWLPAGEDPASGGCGPRSGYLYGETEDYYLSPERPTDAADYGWLDTSAGAGGDAKLRAQAVAEDSQGAPVWVQATADPVWKWNQDPDKTPEAIGIRVDSSDGRQRILSDDFQCVNSNRITGIRLWGAWKNDQKGQITKIRLGIYDNDPAGQAGADATNLFPKPYPNSRWQKEFGPGQFVETFDSTYPFGQWVWDPATGQVTVPGSRQLWQVTINIPTQDAFQQEGSAGTARLYWLAVDIQATGGQFGWETRRPSGHSLGAALWAVQTSTARNWQELRYPPWHHGSISAQTAIDLAFSLSYEDGASVPTAQPASSTQCPVVNTQCPAVSTSCPRQNTQCPQEYTVCPESWTNCPAESTKCPERNTECPVVSTRCPPATVLPAVTTQCPAVSTRCPAQSTRCPQDYTICPELHTNCPAESTKCPERDTECPVVSTRCPPATVLPGVATQCPTVSTRCPAQSTRCPENYTICPELWTNCPQTSTHCPERSTECPTQTTVCPATPTSCRTVPTECPAPETTCKPVTTQCPETSTQCPAPTTTCTPVSTQCPAKTTECPTKATECPVTSCPAQATQCKAVPTECPTKTTECPVTSCPGTPTQCQTVQTQCPTIATQCPEVTTVCPWHEPTKCYPVKTTCPEITTQCPEKNTVCPSIIMPTLCPRTLTECPKDPTRCPSENTKCPVKDTTCPVIETKCMPLFPWTKCPEMATICPEVLTKCPEEPTRCPPITTECPVSHILTYCNPTRCPVVSTQCPEKATECPPVSTECPVVSTECPRVQTKCWGAYTYCLTLCPPLCPLNARSQAAATGVPGSRTLIQDVLSGVPCPTVETKVPIPVAVRQ
jgi:hypothetical protein